MLDIWWRGHAWWGICIEPLLIRIWPRTLLRWDLLLLPKQCLGLGLVGGFRLDLQALLLEGALKHAGHA